MQRAPPPDARALGAEAPRAGSVLIGRPPAAPGRTRGSGLLADVGSARGVWVAPPGGALPHGGVRDRKERERGAPRTLRGEGSPPKCGGGRKGSARFGSSPDARRGARRVRARARACGQGVVLAEGSPGQGPHLPAAARGALANLLESSFRPRRADGSAPDGKGLQSAAWKRGGFSDSRGPPNLPGARGFPRVGCRVGGPRTPQRRPSPPQGARAHGGLPWGRGSPAGLVTAIAATG